jgi:Subunit ChlI of Mg-chelatase
VRPVDVQVQVAPGMPTFTVVGLPDKAVSEARERVRSALIASGLALPARRITINLAPADPPKDGIRLIDSELDVFLDNPPRDRGRSADEPTAIPGAASFRQHAGAGRWWVACAPGRNLAGASRRAVS